MSENDTPKNDNPQTPSDATVVGIDRVEAIRERLRSEEGGKGKGPLFPTPEDNEIPPEQEFEVALLGDTRAGGPSATLNYKGYLVATSVFVGFADEDGIINGLIPLANVLYVKPVEPAA